MLAAALCSPAVSSGTTPANREAAQQATTRANAYLAEGNLRAAFEAFSDAHELMQEPTTGLEVARILAAQSRLIEAREVALEVLRLPRVEAEPQPYVRARSEAEKLAARLTREIPSIVFSVTPSAILPELALRIDGRSVSRAVLERPYALNPGEYKLEFAAAGYDLEVRRVTVQRGDRQALRINLRPSTAPPNRRSSRAGARAGGKPSTTLHWLTWLGVGFAGAGAAAGTTLGIASLSHTAKARQYCESNACSERARADFDAASDTARLSNWAWAGALTGATVAIVGWWISSPRFGEEKNQQVQRIRHEPLDREQEPR